MDEDAVNHVPYVPELQAVHAVVLNKVEYVPCGHDAHERFVEYTPAPQPVHMLATLAPVSVTNVPTGQAVHAEALKRFEYVPARHPVHAAPVLYLPPPQDVQTMLVAPTTTLLVYVPGGHDVHTGPAVDMAPPVLYLPAVHWAHPPAPACRP